ncbi:MAG: mechanosensitive ion channel domain-containing protein [Pseudomonadota bacterium]
MKADRQSGWLLGALKSCIPMIFVVLCFAAPAGAQTPPEAPDAVEAERVEEVQVTPVVVDGNTLFSVRGFSSLPSEKRAETIEDRVIAVAESGAEQITITIEPSEFGLTVFGNGRILTVATDADAELEQTDVELLAALHAEALEAAILAYRASRTNEARVDSAIVAVAWTVGFLLLSFGFRRLRKRLSGAAERFAAGRVTGVEAATRSLVRGKAVGRLAGFAVNIALWVFYIFAFYYYLSFVLLSFTETRPIAQILLTYVSEPLINILRGFVRYVPDLITLIIIAIVTRYLIRALRLFMDNIEAGSFDWPGFEPHWVGPTYNILRVMIILVAVVFSYPHIPGSESRAFQGLTILAGIMVSFGSNTVVSNMMAGLFVVYRRSTNIGDRIKVGDQVGDVVEIKLMETLLRSVKNEMISIPNAQLLNSEVTNYSRTIDGRGLLVHTTVGIGYEEPQEKVEAMLIEAALRTDRLKDSPAPFVLWTALSDYAINYQINAFTTRGMRLPLILSDLHRNIVDVFNENKVQIMTPSYENDPVEPKIPLETWDGTLAVRKTGKAAE